MPDICLLGTGGMLPLRDRFLTSLYYEHNGRAVLIDCGEGTQVAAAAHGVKLSRIECIFITHSHGDHIFGLPGLLSSISNTGRTEELRIFAPRSCIPVINALANITGGLPYPVSAQPLDEDRESDIPLTFIDPLLTVRTLPLSHRVPCLGYCIELRKKPVFEPERARELGVPVEYWKALHSGQSVTLPGGAVIAPGQVTGSQREPVKVVYTTDTLPLPEIAGFAENADLFSCEGMYGLPEKKPSLDEKRHMLMQDACSLAHDAGAKRLWLTHFSPAEKEPEIYEKALKRIFPGVRISSDGERITL